MDDEHVYSHGHTYTCIPTFTKLPLPIQLFFCNIVWNFCKGSGYDYSVKLFTHHFFVKAVQLMKPQLRSLQWKQTQCIYRCLFSSIIKVFLCSISHFITLTCAGRRLCCCGWERLSSLPLHCCCWHHSCSLGLDLRLASLLHHSPYFLDL